MPQPESEKPRSNPPFIEFRYKLDQMQKAGEFSEPVGLMVYTIQERQANEIRNQVQKQSFANEPMVLEVFSRPDVLSQDDFVFFVESLHAAHFWQLLSGLALKSNDWMDKDGAWSQPAHPRAGDPLFLRQFIRDYVRHQDVEQVRKNRADHLTNGFLSARLYNLVTAVFEGNEAKSIYKELEKVLDPDKAQASRFGVEITLLNRLPMAIDAAEGEPAFLGFKMHPGNDAPQVKAWLKRYALFKSIDGERSDTQPSRIMNRFGHYIDALPKDRKGYHVPVIRQVMGKALHDCAEHVIATLSQKSSEALKCFGVPSQKAACEGIPREMFKFIVNVQGSAINRDVQKRLIEQVFVTLLNGRDVKMQSKDVKNVLGMVKDVIDWESCVSKLNAKGRDQLIKEFDDSSYFTKYLGNKDLGKSFSRDLGL